MTIPNSQAGSRPRSSPRSFSGSRSRSRSYSSYSSRNRSRSYSRSRSRSLPYSCSRSRSPYSRLPTKLMVNNLIKNVTDDKWQTNKTTAFVDYDTTESSICHLNEGELDSSGLPHYPLSPLPPRCRGGRFASPPCRFRFVVMLGSILILLCFTTEHFAKAFSISWVYEDLLAHPQYKVVIYENQFIPNSSLEKFAFNDVHMDASRVPTLSQAGSEDNVESKSTSIIMRTGTGKPYVCQIPFIANQTSSEENPEENKGDVDLMKKGLALLEPLKNTCLYYIHGWWTYEYCHLSHVRQFHQVIQPNMKPVEDKSVTSYYLGRYDPRHATLPPSYKDKKGSKIHQQQLGTDLQAGGGKKYLVQRWSDGTKCDLTGKPRRVEIQFHCNPQSKDVIAVITEKYTCHYLVVIHTPRLCNDPAFLSKTLNKVNHIECRRVVSDEKFAQYMDKKRKSLESGENEGETSTEKGGNQHDNEDHSSHIFDDSENKRTRQTKTDKLKDIISKVAEHLKKQGGEGDLNNAREQPFRFYFMDENGQFALVDGNEALLNRKKSTKNKYVDDENEKNEPRLSDYNDILESLIMQNIKFHANKPLEKEKSDDQQSHQAKLSLIYEMNYDDENNDNLDSKNDEKNE